MEKEKLTTEEKTQLFKSAINTYGIDAQLLMVIEECSELINVIAKIRRGRDDNEHLLEELADVKIMVEQIGTHYGYEQMRFWENFKLLRLKERIYKYQNK